VSPTSIIARVARGYGAPLPGRLSVAIAASVVVHAAVLFNAPSLPAALTAPRSSSALLRVEFAPALADFRAAPRARERSGYSENARARPLAPPADVPVPGNATPPREPTPVDEPPEVDYARADNGATAIAREAPAARYAPPPVYPEEARWERRSGRVVLRFHIRPDGSVGDVQVSGSSGHTDLDHAAFAALGEWRFDTPPTGFVKRWYLYAFRFDLM